MYFPCSFALLKLRIHWWAVCVFILSNAPLANAQTTFVPLDPEYNAVVEHFAIQYAAKSPDIFTDIKPYTRKSVAQLADHLLADSTLHLSAVETQNLHYLQKDNWQYSSVLSDSAHTSSPFLRYFYTRPSAFYSVQEGGFQMQINPVFDFEIGPDLQPGLSNTATSINTRGFEIQGTIDKRVSFYSFLTDNQVFFPAYVNRRIETTSAVPGENFYDIFKTTGYDFYTATGYIDFNLTKHINLQFGQGKNFIGDGFRSLELSDYAAPYLFARVITKIGHFDYENTFAQMVADNLGNGGDVNDPRKYMAMHYLSYKFTPDFNVGLFEAVTFGNTDSIHNRGFDPSYLNPVIFYKAVENGLGAPDKDHIGINFKYNWRHRVSIYGTAFIDEFNLAEIKANNGWWANKQAFQLGFKWINLFRVPTLNLQAEGNLIPPYTYTHFSFSNAPVNATNYYYQNFANYSNYDQPLAHPDGANLYELVTILRYQPVYRLHLTGKLIYTLIGLDKNGLDYGSNVLINSNDRVSNTGNYIGQGDKTTIVYANLAATYALIHNLFLDLSLIHRIEHSVSGAYNLNENIVTVGLRYNIARRTNDY